MAALFQLHQHGGVHDCRASLVTIVCRVGPCYTLSLNEFVTCMGHVSYSCHVCVDDEYRIFHLHDILCFVIDNCCVLEMLKVLGHPK